MSLAQLPVFLAVAEASSFSKAAERLRMDKGQVSRVVRTLEERLGAVLFSRTTRSVKLTAAGESLAAEIAPHLAGLDRALASALDRPVTPSGLVTLSTTPDLGRALVAPLLVGFRARFPAVRVRLLLEQRVVGLAEAGVDLALRVGTKGPGGARVQKLGDLAAGFFAAPRYLAARGTPTSPGDLSRHDAAWPSAQRRKSFASGAAPPEPAIDCDDFGALLEIARSGGGIAVLPRYLAARDVAHGLLVEVLPKLALRGAPLFLVTPGERPLPPRIAALRDFVMSEVRTVLAARRVGS